MSEETLVRISSPQSRFELGPFQMQVSDITPALIQFLLLWSMYNDVSAEIF